MKKIFYLLLTTVSLSACGTQESAQSSTAGEPAPEMSKGQKLFINNCIQCHNIKKDKIGPKLEGVFTRWDNDTSRMYAFIRNSQEVIKNGDARAVKVYEEWNHTVMTPMPHLSNGEINEIIAYINKGIED